MREYVNYEDFFSERLCVLRTQHGVSAREMSLAIGQNESYINRIENKKALPSMQGFFYICEYLGVTPRAFFDEGDVLPKRNEALFEKMNPLSTEKYEAIETLVNLLSRGAS